MRALRRSKLAVLSLAFSAGVRGRAWGFTPQLAALRPLRGAHCAASIPGQTVLHTAASAVNSWSPPGDKQGGGAQGRCILGVPATPHTNQGGEKVSVDALIVSVGAAQRILRLKSEGVMANCSASGESATIGSDDSSRSGPTNSVMIQGGRSDVSGAMALDNSGVSSGGGSSSNSSSGSGSSGPRRFRCYTKTGDKGFSSLYSGERRRKDDWVFGALGDVDELNSAVGLAAEYCSQQGLSDVCGQLAEIQSRLLDVGSAVATPKTSSSASKLRRVKFDEEAVGVLERWLDAMDDQLPPLTNFILPSGGLAAAHLHVARSLCRRAERAVVALALSESSAEAARGMTVGVLEGGGREVQEEAVGKGVGDEEVIEKAVVQYLNRLSDYLFTAARFAALQAGRDETTYKKSV